MKTGCAGAACLLLFYSVMTEAEWHTVTQAEATVMEMSLILQVFGHKLIVKCFLAPN